MQPILHQLRKLLQIVGEYVGVLNSLHQKLFLFFICGNDTTRSKPLRNKHSLHTTFAFSASQFVINIILFSALGKLLLPELEEL